MGQSREALEVLLDRSPLELHLIVSSNQVFLFISFIETDMSLSDARMPRLIDKLEAEAEAAEKLRAALEKVDVKQKKVIKSKKSKNIK